MIDLTPDQISALASPEKGPPRFKNPQTQELFVLVPLAEYGRLIEEMDYEDAPWTDEERDLLRAEACDMLDSLGKNP